MMFHIVALRCQYRQLMLPVDCSQQCLILRYFEIRVGETRRFFNQSYKILPRPSLERYTIFETGRPGLLIGIVIAIVDS